MDPRIPIIQKAKATSILPYCPEEPTDKQLEFLRLKNREALFGGSASGGKSSALLMSALQYVDYQDYACLILRRTYTDLARPGAIMDRAHAWLSGTDAKWDGHKKTWLFPSGARITFGYLETESDKWRYQGSELQTIIFDELTQFEQSQYLYLMTRLRRKFGSKIPLRIRCATNPGGVGHSWCKERFIDRPNEEISFVPARVEDNPHVDQASYRINLEQLDETTKRQLLYGEWITDAQQQLYKFSPERNLAYCLPGLPYPKEWTYVLGIDLGASQVKATTAFCIVAFNDTTPVAYIVHCEASHGMYPTTIAERIRELIKQYGHMKIVIDEGALGKGYGEEFRRRYHIPVEPAQKRDKLGHRRLINGAFERGEIKLLPGTEVLQKELVDTIWDDRGLDAYKGQELHNCLVGGSLIETLRGEVPIKDVVIGDFALTRQGYCRVTASAYSGRKQIYSLRTSCGRLLRGSGNHPVFVENKGWVPIDALLYGDMIVVCQKKNISSLTAENIQDVSIPVIDLKECITYQRQRQAPGCIEIYGPSITAKSLKGITSIIKTAIRSIMTLKILNALRLQNICLTTVRIREISRKYVNIFLRQEKQRKNGMPLPKESNGTVNTASIAGSAKEALTTCVSFAKPNSAQEPIQQKSAQENVMPKQEDVQALITNKEIAHGAKKYSFAESTRNKNFAHDYVLELKMESEEEVYDLTVEKAHEFFADGILVKNSDAMLYSWHFAKSWMSEHQAPTLPEYNTELYWQQREEQVEQEAIRKMEQQREIGDW